MKYYFDTTIPRCGTNSYKWYSLHQLDILPMWVADMDFLTVPVVTESIHKKAKQGNFCYTRESDSYNEAIVHWGDRRYAWKIQSDRILYTTGVGSVLSAIIRALQIKVSSVSDI